MNKRNIMQILKPGAGRIVFGPLRWALEDQKLDRSLKPASKPARESARLSGVFLPRPGQFLPILAADPGLFFNQKNIFCDRNAKALYLFNKLNKKKSGKNSMHIIV
jgi:hypothetical protein